MSDTAPAAQTRKFPPSKPSDGSSGSTRTRPNRTYITSMTSLLLLLNLNNAKISITNNYLAQYFYMNNLSSPTNFLSINIARNWQYKTISIDQSSYRSHAPTFSNAGLLTCGHPSWSNLTTLSTLSLWKACPPKPLSADHRISQLFSCLFTPRYFLCSLEALSETRLQPTWQLHAESYAISKAQSISQSDQAADILTKPLHALGHHHHLLSLGLSN